MFRLSFTGIVASVHVAVAFSRACEGYLCKASQWRCRIRSMMSLVFHAAVHACFSMHGGPTLLRTYT